MQHSILDRIYIAFLIILLASFGILLVFLSFYTRRFMINERKSTLYNEASLIASQTVEAYIEGNISPEDLEQLFDYYSATLNADVWFVDKDGMIVATSSAKKLEKNSSSDAVHRGEVRGSIYDIFPDYNIRKLSYKTGNFNGTFSNSMLSVNVPVNISLVATPDKEDVRNAGAIIIHESTLQINNLLRNIYSISVLPCLVIIAIAFIFLGIISHKIIRPVRRLSDIADEYSKGNFEVETGIDTNDEIGQLADSMEYMAGELSKLEDYRRDFVSNISHDFRSPLTSIKGYIQAIKDGVIPAEKQDKYLDIVLNETNRLTKLTQGLLELENFDNYGPYLKLENFDMIDVIQNTLNTFEMKAEKKKVSIYLHNHSEDTVVTADKTKIQQVFYNLIDNALKFTPAGKQIDVSVVDKDKKLMVSVKDQGIGMDEETRKKVFVRFYKGDQSRGKDKTGTGLGLAIAKEVIKAHNEMIEVKSTEGEGSEFYFTLTKKTEDIHTDNLRSMEEEKKPHKNTEK